MSPSLIAALLWLVAANVIGLLPTKDHHWRSAYILIGFGIPILGWVTYENGPILGLVMAAGGASVLRWPLYFLARWVKRKVKGPAE
jgi:Protein of unknown function (DUF2484)